MSKNTRSAPTPSTSTNEANQVSPLTTETARGTVSRQAKGTSAATAVAVVSKQKTSAPALRSVSTRRKAAVRKPQAKGKARRRKMASRSVNAVGVEIVLHKGPRTQQFFERVRATGTEGGVVSLVSAGRVIKAGALYGGDGRYCVWVGPYTILVSSPEASDGDRRIEVHANTRLCYQRGLQEILVHVCTFVDGLTNGIDSGRLISSYPALRPPKAIAHVSGMDFITRQGQSSMVPLFKFETRFVCWAAKIALKQAAGAKR